MKKTLLKLIGGLAAFALTFTACQMQPLSPNAGADAADSRTALPAYMKKETSSVTVLIHGVGGSSLMRSDTGAMIWSKAQIDAMKADPIFHRIDMNQLSLDANGNSINPLVPVDGMDGNDLFLDNLGSLRKQIMGIGMANTFGFSYDWRLSNDINANRLEAFVNDLKAKFGVAKVNLVAYSMGGLVAAKYLSKNTNTDNVAKMIFIASPLGGSAMTIELLVRGAYTDPNGDIWSQIKDLVSSDAIKTLSRNMASSYQLLPNRLLWNRHANLYQGQYLDLSGTHNFSFVNYDDMLNYVKGLYQGYLTTNKLNPALVDKAAAFHDSMDLPTVLSKVDSYFIAGTGLTTANGEIIFSGSGGSDIAVRYVTQSGDSSVPEESASLAGLVNPTRYFSNPGVGHEDMPRDINTCNLVTQILRNQVTTNSQPPVQGGQAMASLDSHFEGSNLPATAKAGTTLQVTLRVTNSGTDSWTWSQGHRLILKSNLSGVTLPSRVLLNTNEVVPCGTTREFSFPLTLSSTVTGTLNLSWQMAIEAGAPQFFGEIINQTLSIDTPVLGTKGGTQAVLLGDLNGDGRTDAVFIDKTGLKSHYALSDINGQMQFAGSLPTGENSGTYRFLLADVNGDKRADLVSWRPVGNEVWVGLSDASGRPAIWSQSLTVGITAAGAFTGYTADVNGDRCQDLILVQSQGLTTYILPGSPAGLNAAGLKSVATGESSGTYKQYFADVNGDGLDDMIQFNSSQTTWWVGLGNAQGSFTIWNKMAQDNAGSSTYRILFADFSGDRLADLVEISKTGLVSRIAKGLGDGTFGSWGTIATGDSNGTYYVATGDLNGDGYADLVQNRVNGSEAWIGFSLGGAPYKIWSSYLTGLPATFQTCAVVDTDRNGIGDLVLVGDTATLIKK